MLPPDAAFLKDLQDELAVTRTLLVQIPNAIDFAWKPHAKSMAFGGLGAHIANLLTWRLLILNTEELDIATPFPPRSCAVVCNPSASPGRATRPGPAAP